MMTLNVAFREIRIFEADVVDVRVHFVLVFNMHPAKPCGLQHVGPLHRYLLCASVLSSAGRTEY